MASEILRLATKDKWFVLPTQIVYEMETYNNVCGDVCSDDNAMDVEDFQMVHGKQDVTPSLNEPDINVIDEKSRHRETVNHKRSRKVRKQGQLNIGCQNVTPVVAIMDIQMIYYKEHGFVIKELAYRPLNDRNVYSMTFKHDGTIPGRVRVYHGRAYDSYTGLELEAGEYQYSDYAVADVLNNLDVVFVKGGNKKRLLTNLWNRVCESVPERYNRRLKVVNVDANTVETEDAEHCRLAGRPPVNFSFPFIYQHFDVYMDMLNIPLRATAGIVCNPIYHDSATTLPVYVNNALLHHYGKHSIAGKGRCVCICHNNHVGGNETYTMQRCAIMNLGLIETLWYQQRNVLMSRIVKDLYRNTQHRDTVGTRRVVNGKHGGKRRQVNRRFNTRFL